MNNKKQKLNRRSFMGHSAKIAAAGFMLNKLPASSKKLFAFEGEIKIAVIGCGGRGTGAVSQAIEADKDVRLVAMADAFKDQTDECLKSLNEKYPKSEQINITEETIFTGFDAYKNAIDLADVVILTTPPAFRPIHFEYAINQNKHVFMEKPVATDISGIKKILKAGKKAKEKQLNVVVGLQRHYQKNYKTIKSLIDRGKIGDIVSGQVYWNSGGVWVRPREKGQTELEYQMRNWYYFNWLCGDHIVEQHIHNIDVANWFIGSTPTSAQGMGGREVRKGKDHGQIFDHHFVEFTYASGAVISSQCRHIRGTMRRVDEVFQGTKGSVEIGKGEITDLDGNSQYKYPNKWGEDSNPYQVEHDRLFASIRNGGVIADAENGAKSTLTAILGRMATYTGKKITFDEALNSKLHLMPEEVTWNTTPPSLPDENGNYSIPTPGKTKFV